MLLKELSSTFSSLKDLLLKQEFWGLSFEIHIIYGLNNARRLHTRKNMKWQNFIMILKIDIYEIA
jgi:hypothetical protein